MNPKDEAWPPPPVRPEPAVEADADGDWLAANDLVTDITWRDYATTAFAVLWGLLACVAIAVHHHLPSGAIQKVHQIIRTVSP